MQNNHVHYPGGRRRLIVFAVLAFAVFVLSIDILGMLGAGDPKDSQAPVTESINNAWTAADANARQFLEREHQTITSEIQLRIQLEHLLFALKFGLVGGTLYLLFQQAYKRTTSRFQRTEFAALVSWAAVVAATIVDLRLAANQTFLITLGGWIRQYETLRLGHDGVALGWEAFLADNLLSQPYYPALRVSTQILTSLLFCLTAAMFFLSPGKSHGRGNLVSGAGAMLSIVLMTVAGVSLRQGYWAMVTYLAVGSTAALAAAILIFGSRAPAKRAVEPTART